MAKRSQTWDCNCSEIGDGNAGARVRGNKNTAFVNVCQKLLQVEI